MKKIKTRRLDILREHYNLLKERNGITLITLVITIIILLMLAGITISQLIGNGLLEKAKEAKETSTKAQIKEEIELKLMEIVTEYTSQNKIVTNKIIKEELEKKLSEIEVSEDLTGTYKKYDYQIDENYNVHIIGKENKSMKVKVNSKIGTSYITINVEASSTNGDIVQYDYIIDGVTYSSTNSEYKIENLDPESKHTIKVVVIDEKQNKKETGSINVTTEARTYLYKEGNECENITNGWSSRFLNGTNSGVGKVTNENNNIYIETWGTWCSYGAYTSQKIDFSNYSKIFIELYDIKKVDTGYGSYGFFLGEGSNNMIVYKYFSLENEEIHEGIDISQAENLITNCYIFCDNGISCRIKNVWLEI